MPEKGGLLEEIVSEIIAVGTKKKKHHKVSVARPCRLRDN
jgi:hypothetical protein